MSKYPFEHLYVHTCLHIFSPLEVLLRPEVSISTMLSAGVQKKGGRKKIKTFHSFKKKTPLNPHFHVNTVSAFLFFISAIKGQCCQLYNGLTTHAEHLMQFGFFSPNMTSRLLNKDSTACIVATQLFHQATEDFTVVVYIFCCSTSVLKTSPGPAYTMQALGIFPFSSLRGNRPLDRAI